ncbi:MAG TPA: class I SAM-dependent methyltransferase [Paludibacter sp.]|nr:class I SAM-dependent methyltransferase [Paludibacter sp.]
MSNEEYKNIHEFDFNLICEYFSSIERQGPGSEESTLKALSFIDNLNKESVIADLGCGTGGQTMVLAQHCAGTITGLDLFADFIEIFNRNASTLELENKVKGIVGSMDNLPFENESLDLIWSEGAIYNVGFERGVTEWRKYLKKGGYIAVTEASWFTDERPAEINDFWNEAYPEIDTIPVKMAQLQKAGYIPVAAFCLPEYCWTDVFYKPQGEAQRFFREKYPDNPTAKELLDNLNHEEKMYQQYKEYYGYVFYIGKKL